MKVLKGTFLTVAMATCLTSTLWAQAQPNVEDLINDTKNTTDVTRGILDYKPRSLKLYAASKAEYDTNVYKSDNDLLWDDGNRKKSDTIWKNTVLADYNFNTEEDHALGVKYMGEFDFYHDNKNKELGMHDLGAFYQYDMDPDPISLRCDFDYKFIRIGEEAFLNTKDTEGLIKVKYNELFDASSHVYQKGEYRVKFSYNQYKANSNDIQDETGLDTTFKYKHILTFSKVAFPKTSKYVKSIDFGFEYKNSNPRNDDSEYGEGKFRPKVKFRNLPFKCTGKIEWIYYDRRYKYRTDDVGDSHRHDRRNDAKFGLARRLNKYLNLNLDYARGWRTSNVASKEYHNNIYSLSLSALF